MTEHRRVAGIIRRYVNRIKEELPGVAHGAGESAIRFVEAHAELRKTIPDAPALPALVDNLRDRVVRRNIFEINSNSDVDEYPLALNFLVGGNILGRGITIENLLVTYYLRAAKITQMDTVLQHARMFGYRAKIMRYTRLYSPQSLIERFSAIHEAERELRALLRVATPSAPLAVVTPVALRATRAQVLDTRTLSAITPGQKIVLPPRPPGAKPTPTVNRQIRERIEAIAASAAEKGDARRLRCTVTELIELVEMQPYDEGDGWPSADIVAVLRSIRPRYQHSCWLYTRDTSRTDVRPRYGGLRGTELAELEALAAPVLSLLFDTGEKSGSAHWVPSFIFPKDMATHVFNTTQA